MKILITPATTTGHLNPVLSLTRILIAGGHEVLAMAASAARGLFKDIGGSFRPFSGSGDLDLRSIDRSPELKGIPPGPALLHAMLGRGLVEALTIFPAETEKAVAGRRSSNDPRLPPARSSLISAAELRAKTLHSQSADCHEPIFSALAHE
jgi:hypothetical protein